MKKSAITILGLCALGLVGVGFEQSSAAIEFSSQTNVGFNFNKVLSVNISGDIEINGLAAGQQKDSNSVGITVNTNSSDGYILSASVGDSTHNNSDLALDANNKFTSIATSDSLASLTSNNTWGYKTSENDSSWSNYGGLALYSASEMSVLRETNEMPSGGSETTYFKIGAKASVDIVTGDYTNNITFYAVTKALLITLADITTMQEVTPEICTNTPTPLASAGENTPQYQLEDTRDGKLYWVAKLADGNCWMTQNLDFVLDPSKPLTSEDSDVTSNWTPSIATQTTQYKELNGTMHTTGVDNALWNTTDTTFGYNYAPHSYRPASDAAAGTSGDFGNDGRTYFSPVFMQNGTTMKDWKTMADCTGAGNSEELCAHWNVGTFYSWYAATAGTGNNSVTSSGANVSNSICPKGWRLPKSGSSDNDFQALVNNGMTETNITDAPFYFLRSGYYDGYYGAVYDTGRDSLYWSSTSTSSSSIAYLLYFNSAAMYPSYYTNRYYGVSVHCVAR